MALSRSSRTTLKYQPRTYCPFAGVLLSLSLLGFTAALAESPAEIDASGDTLHYAGDLTADGLATLKRTHAGRHPAPTWLVMNSGGGEVNVAMDFGDWVYAQNLALRVTDRCLSGCANYVFTAAPVKVIEPGAIVAWHGSAVLTEQASRAQIDAVIERDILPRTAHPEREAVRRRVVDDTLAYLSQAVARQTRFFEKIGVDERVTRAGLDHPAVSDFWFLSVAAMQRFGIERVVAPTDYAATDTQRFGPGSVVYLDLDRDNRQ